MRVSGGTGFSVYNEQFASIVKYNTIVVSRISLLHGHGERQIFASSQATSQGAGKLTPTPMGKEMPEIAGRASLLY